MAMVNLVKDGKGYRIPEQNLQKALSKGYMQPSPEEARRFEQPMMAENNQQMPVQDNMQPPQEQQASFMDVLKGKLGEWGERGKNVGNLVIGGSNAVSRQIADSLNFANKLNPMSHGNIEAPQLNPLSGTKEDWMYNIGEGMGNFGGLVAGGGGLNALRKGLEVAPGVLGKAMQYLGGEGALQSASRLGIGNALYGAAENPEHMIAGALSGGALGAAPTLTTKAVKKGYEGLSPTIAASKFGQNAKNTFRELKQGISNIYQPVLDQFGAGKLYDKLMPVMTSAGGKRTRASYELRPPKDTAYGGLPEKYIDKFGPKIDDMHLKFINDPTFDKAHKYQSQLGSEIRKLKKKDQKGTLDAIEDDRLYAFQMARDSLKKDIGSYLDRSSPAAAEKYLHGSEEFVNKIRPFIDDPSIAKLVKDPKFNLKPKNVDKIAEKIKDDEYLSSLFGDKLASLQAKTALPGWLGKKVSPLTNALGINKMGAPLAEMGAKNIPKGYDAIRQALIANLLANRGNQQ